MYIYFCLNFSAPAAFRSFFACATLKNIALSLESVHSFQLSCRYFAIQGRSGPSAASVSTSVTKLPASQSSYIFD